MELVPAFNIQEWVGNEEIIKQVVHCLNIFFAKILF